MEEIRRMIHIIDQIIAQSEKKKIKDREIEKTIKACKACEKVQVIEQEEDGDMAWITCSKWGRQRAKTCRTCTHNESNPYGKKAIRKARIARGEPAGY